MASDFGGHTQSSTSQRVTAGRFEISGLLTHSLRANTGADGFSQAECNEIATSQQGTFGGFGGAFLGERYSQIIPLPPYRSRGGRPGIP